MEFGAGTHLSRCISEVSTTLPPVCAWSDRIALRADIGVDLIMVLITDGALATLRRAFRVITDLMHTSATTSSASAANRM